MIRWCSRGAAVACVCAALASCKAPEPPRKTYTDAQRAEIEQAISAMNARADKLEEQRVRSAKEAAGKVAGATDPCALGPELARLAAPEAQAPATLHALDGHLDVSRSGEPTRARLDAQATARRYHDLLFAEPDDAEAMVRDAKDETASVPKDRPLLLLVRAEVPRRVEGTLVLFDGSGVALCATDIVETGAEGQARDDLALRAAQRGLRGLAKLR